MSPRSDAARTLEPSAVQCVEEAVHLLRQAPASAWLVYVLGAASWVLGFLGFWAYTSWFVPSDAEIGAMALGLVVLFALLKTCQSEFSARLLALRLNRSPAHFSWARARRLAATQLRVHAWGSLALPVAAMLTVPFGWAFAFFQTVTVLGENGGEGLPVTAEAWTEAKRWPRQNHLGGVFLSVLAGACWLNVALAFFLVPWLANRLLGVESLYGVQGWAVMNSTFLALVTAISWLAVDPLIKAFYVLRVFYGRSQRTGEDLEVELAAATAPRTRAGPAIAAVCCLALTLLPADAPAATTPVRVANASVESATAPAAPPQSTTTANHTTAAVAPEELNRAINQVLTQSDFRWQLRPLPRERDASAAAEAGWIRRFVRATFDLLGEVWGGFLTWIGDLWDWVKELFSFGDEEEEPAGEGGSVVRVLLYGLIALLLILLVAVLVAFARAQRVPRRKAVAAQPVATPAPDLADEALHAGHLPSEAWLLLAQEQMRKGEWRLALRALYLATLARLAAQGQIALAKSKTNLDYERELVRRAPTDPALQQRFALRRREYEKVWYGRAAAAEDQVRSWFDALHEEASP